MNYYEKDFIKMSKESELEDKSKGMILYNSNGGWNTLMLAEELVRISKKKRIPANSYKPFTYCKEIFKSLFSDEEIFGVAIIFAPFLLLILFGQLIGVLTALFGDIVLFPIGIFNYFYEKYQ